MSLGKWVELGSMIAILAKYIPECISPVSFFFVLRQSSATRVFSEKQKHWSVKGGSLWTLK